MRQNILVAFDDSQNSTRAVEYIARTLNRESRVTLFSVLPDTAALCDMNSPELTAYFKAQQMAFCALEDQKKKLVEDAMERARGILVEAGFEAGQINLRAEPKKKGVARDIIAEAATGYDLVVMGRRGTSGVRDFFLGSVSQKVLHALRDVSLLIVN